MSGFDPTHGAHGNAVSGDTHHKGNTVHAPIPDTVVGVDGSSKRNIIRKGKKKGGDICDPFTLGCPWCPLEYHGNRRSHREYIFGALKAHGEEGHKRNLSLLDVTEDAPAAKVFAKDAKAVTAGCDALQDLFLLTWNVASAVKNLVALTRLMGTNL